MTALLEIRNASKVYGSGVFSQTRNVALDNFNYVIDDAEPTITAIVGESGSGKTTLVRMLLGLAAPTTGEVLYRGSNLHSLKRQERRAFLREVQAIFQDPFEVYNPFYKVDHVLESPIKNFKLTSNKDEARQMMEDVLSAVGLRPDETLGRFPHQLSGGQRQRIMVARALLLRPKVIIADEPVSMVDASLRATILETLVALNREFGISLVYITHDLTTAYQISNDVIVLYRGDVAEAGAAELTVPNPEHPYTRLLVGSIPLPDPEVEWKGERVLGTPVTGLVPTGDSYCRFYERCPFAMQECVEQKPPLFLTSTHRATACYLYKDNPTLPAGDVSSVIGLKEVQV